MKRYHAQYAAALAIAVLILANAVWAVASSPEHSDSVVGGNSSSVCEGAVVVISKVVYDANGGSGGLTESGMDPEDDYTILTPAQAGVSRGGYTFTGWNTRTDGLGAGYAAGLHTNISGRLTLYAQWARASTPVPADRYTAIYDANGGTGGRTVTGLSPGAYTVLTQAQTGVSRNGYSFTGWNTRNDGTGTACAAGQFVTLSGSVTFYAQWVADGGTTPPGSSESPDPPGPPESPESPGPSESPESQEPPDGGHDPPDPGDPSGDGDDEPFPKTGVDDTAPWWIIGLCLSCILPVLLLWKRRRSQDGGRRGLSLPVLLCLLSSALCVSGLIRDAGERAEGRSYYAELAARAVCPEDAIYKTSPAPHKAGPDGAQTVHVAAYTAPVDFASLRAYAPGLTAWLTCEGTVIDYLVMQGDDNAYYLNHLPDGTRNKAGSLFLDHRNAPDFSDANSVIYGHHMRGGDMFGELEAYKSQDYFEKHPIMRLETEEKTYHVELFAGYLFDPAGETLPRRFEDAAGFSRFVAEIRARSFFTSDVAVGPGDRLVSLATCAYDFTNARWILAGKLVESN